MAHQLPKAASCVRSTADIRLEEDEQDNALCFKYLCVMRADERNPISSVNYRVTIAWVA